MIRSPATRRTLSQVNQPADIAEAYRQLTADLLAEDLERRGQWGQFFTPEGVARFIAAWVTPRARLSILDAGAGVGALTAACIEAALDWPAPPTSISATVYEIDPNIIPFLRSTLNECAASCAARGIQFDYQIESGDFVEHAAQLISGQHTLFDSARRWDVAILNPPYRKISVDSPERVMLQRVGIETSNIYAGFLWLASKLLNVDGELIAITPRSFCNGPYFLPLRKTLLKDFWFEHIHVYESRSRVFGDDAVLQENILFKLKRTHAHDLTQTLISTSDDPYGPISERHVEHAQIVRADDPELFIHVTPDAEAEATREHIEAMPCSLSDLGLTVSTGRVVDFRAKAALRDWPIQGETAPLIYPLHIVDGFVRWPAAAARKPNAIVHSADTQDLLVPSEPYVLVRRFSAKEELKRVVAALYDPTQIKSDKPISFVGFENHLNYYHEDGRGLDPTLAKGLMLYLNTTMVDQYFRQFNGHTQVNATDLRKLRYPTRQQLQMLGAQLGNTLPAQPEIDRLVSESLKINQQAMPRTSGKKSRINLRINEALEVLKALNLPREQHNERSALTLLALLNLKPQTSWTDASASLLGITEIMSYVREHYNAHYAPNTRETFRRFTMHQFVQAGLVLHNPDDPQRPTNSPANRYQVEPAALALLRTYGAPAWGEQLADYFSKNKGIQALQAHEREMKLIPVRLPDGSAVQLSGGGQNVLIKQIIEIFCPRFTPGGTVLYVGDAGKKMQGMEVEAFAKLGITLHEHGKMPDVVVHYTERNWLVVIEAVTSHGPINIKRHNELAELFADCSAGLVYVTAFATRAAVSRYMREIAWETDVWVAENPTHLIHFNGERFLGPY